MKAKVFLSVGIFAAVLAFSVYAAADQVEVIFKATTYCLGVDDCRDFASWGGTAAGYVVFEASNGSPSEYLWVDGNGLMTFESELPGGGFGELPPSGLVLLATLPELPTLQEIDQYFPGGVTRPLFVLSPPATPTPEPATLLLVGPAVVFLVRRARRFLRP